MGKFKHLSITRKEAQAMVVAGLMLAPAFVFAADATWSQELVSMVMGVVAVVSSVGMAVMSVYVTIKTFKWVRRAI